MEIIKIDPINRINFVKEYKNKIEVMDFMMVRNCLNSYLVSFK
jgi:hypothetical protein